MGTCSGCSCTRPEGAPDGDRLLLSTRVVHHATMLGAILRGAGSCVTERAPGLLEVRTDDPAGLIATAVSRLTAVEADEVRALVVADEEGDGLLAAALSAPTLAQLGARSAHADLLTLFADERRAFRSVYQRIVSLAPGAAGAAGAAGATVGYEALLRAVGPDGALMPRELFDTAHQAGWLHVLDRIGRTTALRGAAGWLGDALLFVNFLPTSIYRPEICLKTTENAARQAGVPLSQLVFEVTESEVVTDIDHLASVFDHYRRRGCRVALDDMGAGYSSLNMLVQLQPDFVKLDKDIVQRLPDPASAAVVAAVVDITHSYGGKVVAECIETAEQAATATELGVDLGQGWLFGRPEEREVLPVPGTAHAGGARRARGTRELRDVRQVRGAQEAQEAQAVRAVRADLNPYDYSGNDPSVALLEAIEVTTPRPDARTAAGHPDDTGGLRYPSAANVDSLLARAVAVGSGCVSVVDALAPGMPLIYVNRAFEALSGYDSAEVVGRNCRLLQGPDTDPVAVAGLAAAVAAGQDHVAVLKNYRRDGTSFWNELRVSPVTNSRGQVTHYFGFQADVSARVEAEQRLDAMAEQDDLTGLLNRTGIRTVLEESLQGAVAAGDRLAVLFIDLDRFKVVNEQLGHAAGDLALAACAARLRAALREGDRLGRYGGDEFVAVLTGVDPRQALAIAERAVREVNDQFDHPRRPGESVRFSASVGVACYPGHASTADDLLTAADQAMYAGKSAGGRSAKVADPSDPATGQPPGQPAQPG